MESEMTHDELLAKIDELDHSCSVVGITVGALRAVMELHKPVTHKSGLVFCSTNCEGDYPCPTIQAIEKELR